MVSSLVPWQFVQRSMLMLLFVRFAFLTSFGFSIMFTIRMYRNSYPVIGGAPKGGEYMERKDRTVVSVS